MRIYTVTCDGRPAAVVRAKDAGEAVALTLDLAEARNLLGVVAAPRRFVARPASERETAEWNRHQIECLILDTPIAA
jgi:hypothetical protein